MGIISTDPYELVAGCARGISCSKGYYCNGDDGPRRKCSPRDPDIPCSFENCMQYAINDNSDGFSYSANGTLHGGDCYMCTYDEIATRKTIFGSTDGVYRKRGACKFMTILHYSMLTFIDSP